jgi:hypothetical protein
MPVQKGARLLEDTSRSLYAGMDLELYAAQHRRLFYG